MSGERPAPQIVVVGSINMDFVLRAPRHPRVGETVQSSSDLRLFPGGKGANQAHCAARLGARVAMVGCVGNDTFGADLKEGLARSGIDTTHVATVEDAATGVGLIVVDEAGNNTIVVSAGANGRITVAAVEAAEAMIASADLMLLQLEIPLPVVAAAARLARVHGVTTLLNPAPYQPLHRELLAHIDVLVPNETEAALLAGEPHLDLNGFDSLGTALRKEGVKTVIVTRGSDGATLLDSDGATHFPAHAVAAVDTTAAGDAFVGAFAVAFAGGATLKETVRYGNAAGAVAATKPGAQPSLPTRSEVDAMLASAVPGTG